MRKIIIAYSHPKGGVGKSLTAFNHAVYLQHIGEPATVVDLDGQHSISDINKLRLANGLPGLDIRQFTDANSLLEFAQMVDATVIIDTGGFDSALNRATIAIADIIITPVKDSPIELMRLQSYNSILNEISKSAGYEINAHILLNRIYHSRKNIDDVQAIINQFDRLKLIPAIIHARSPIENSIVTGESIFDSQKEEYASSQDDFTTFFEALNQISKGY